MQPCVRVLAVAIGLTLALTISETKVSAAPEHSPASSAVDPNVEVKLPPLAPGQEMVVLVRRPEQAPEVAVLMILPPEQAEQALGRPLARAAEPVAEPVASSASVPEAGGAPPSSVVLDVQPSRLPTAGSLDGATPEPSLTALAGMLLAGLGFSIRRARRGVMMGNFGAVGASWPWPWPFQLAGVEVSHTGPAVAAGAPVGVCDWQAGYGDITGGSSRPADGTGSTEAAGRREASADLNGPQAALHGRYDAASLLEATRRLAARGSPRELAAELLDAAIQMLGGTGGLVSRFDQASGRLIPVCQQPDTGEPAPLAPRRGASSRAVQRRGPVILDDYQPRRRTGSRSTDAYIRASIGVPLLYEGQVLGALEVQTSEPGRRFSEGDADVLELLAGMATAVLLGLQRAWLEGIRLTLRTVQHQVNNDLTLASGYAEFLTLNAFLPAEVRQAATKVQQGARAAASILNELEPPNRLQADVWSRPTATAIRVGPWAAGQPARSDAPGTPGGVRRPRRASAM